MVLIYEILEALKCSWLLSRKDKDDSFQVAEKKYYSLEMPNALNVSISFYWVLIGAALFYIPGFPQHYLYMFAQREKVPSTDTAKKKM
ncbi:hypothetical protein OSTOST_02740 [Ostertagia ostertagi]